MFCNTTIGLAAGLVWIAVQHPVTKYRQSGETSLLLRCVTRLVSVMFFCTCCPCVFVLALSSMPRCNRACLALRDTFSTPDAPPFPPSLSLARVPRKKTVPLPVSDDMTTAAACARCLSPSDFTRQHKSSSLQSTVYPPTHFAAASSTSQPRPYQCVPFSKPHTLTCCFSPLDLLCTHAGRTHHASR